MMLFDISELDEGNIKVKLENPPDTSFTLDQLFLSCIPCYNILMSDVYEENH